MTPKLTQREKEINSILKTTSSKVPTKQDYLKWAKNKEDVNTCTEENISSFPVSHSNTEEKITVWNSDISSIDIQEVENIHYQMASTEEFFTLKIHTGLLSTISHKFYTNAEFYDKHKPLYDAFLDDCKVLDEVKKYIEIACPNFDKSQKEYRKQFKQLAEQFPSIKLFERLHTFFMNYNLNQINKAKIDALLALQLPQITHKEAKLLINIINLQK